MHFLRNRGFAYKGDFDAKEAPKIEPISSIWGSFAPQIASKMLLHFIQILGSMFRGFGDIFGRFRDHFGRLCGSRACFEGVLWQPFWQGGPQRVPENDLGQFWLHFGRVSAPFWEGWAPFWEVCWQASLGFSVKLGATAEIENQAETRDSQNTRCKLQLFLDKDRQR